MVAIVGAGLCGLVAAYRLTQAGYCCDVYERWPGLGGQAATVEIDSGLRLERYYHHLFQSDRAIVELYKELDLADEIEWHRSSTAVFIAGRQFPFVSARDLLTFTPLPLMSRVRLGFGTLLLQRVFNRQARFERVTARRWIERWMGRSAWELVWGPLLNGKFGPRADDIAMVWLWSKLRLRRSLRAEGFNSEQLGYPRHSWERLFSALSVAVEKGGGRVLIDRPVKQISRGQRGFTVIAGQRDSFRQGHNPQQFVASGPATDYDAVVATVPNDIFTALLSPQLRDDLGPAYSKQLASIEYGGALCLLIELDRQFSPFYWTNIADERLPFIGLIEHTNLVSPDRYNDRHYLYVANYLPPGHELIKLSADDLLARYEPGLRQINPRFEHSQIKRYWRFYEPAAQPVVTVGYSRLIPSLQTPVAGLLLANTTQIFPQDRGTNYAVELGARAAAEAMKFLESSDAVNTGAVSLVV